MSCSHIALNKDDEIIGYEFVNFGKMMDFIKKGDDALAAKVTSTLKDMYNDGTVEKLIEKYADYGMSAENWVLK